MLTLHSCALLGLGRWGRVLLAEFSQHCEVRYCLTTGSEESASWLRSQYPNILLTADYDLILNDKSIDFVVIATPINTHFELSKRAILHDKHVFLEKSPTTSHGELIELKELAEHHKKIIFVDHIYAYAPMFLVLKTHLVSESIESISCQWLKLGSFRENIYWNLFYHFIYLVGKVVRIPDTLDIKYELGGVSDIDVVLATMHCGELQVPVYINRVSSVNHMSISITTERSVYILSNNQLERIDRSSGVIVDTFSSEEEPLGFMVWSFLEYLTQNECGLVTPNALECVRTLERIPTSVNTANY